MAQIKHHQQQTNYIEDTGHQNIQTKRVAKKIKSWKDSSAINNYTT